MAKTFWRLSKQDYFMAAIELKKRIPQLKSIGAEEITDNLRGSNMQFYQIEKVVTPVFIRITLPFALLTALFLFILLPINYMVVGRWGYKWQWLSNWFRSLGF